MAKKTENRSRSSSRRQIVRRFAEEFGIEIGQLSQWISESQRVGSGKENVAKPAYGIQTPVGSGHVESTVACKSMPGSAQNELRSLVELLSEPEALRLLPTITNVASGERFWEEDVGLFYNEYVKTRHMSVARGHTGLVSAELENSGSYYAPVSVPNFERDPRWMQLPTPQPISTSLTQLLRERRSRRDYAESAVWLVELATLLEHACGITGTVTAYGYQNLALRTFPSTGGLQSPDLYLFVRNVERLAMGLYRYHPLVRSLELIEGGDYSPLLASIFFQNRAVDRAAAVIVVVGNYARVKWKYGARSYRYMCMDIGFLGQNLQLAAEGLGLGSCPIAAFVEDGLEEVLRIDGKEQFALLGWTLGRLVEAAP
jgi:SagB-type dehydrogenase family enzyme